jgi:hypothetical protein
VGECAGPTFVAALGALDLERLRQEVVAGRLVAAASAAAASATAATLAVAAVAASAAAAATVAVAAAVAVAVGVVALILPDDAAGVVLGVVVVLRGASLQVASHRIREGASRGALGEVVFLEAFMDVERIARLTEETE